jgi:uncharacterized protein (TIGR03435 family)
MRQYLVAVALIRLLFAQNVAAQNLKFEVASVKPNKSGNVADSITTTGCRFVATNLTLKGLINIAYRPPNGQLRRDEVIGGPAWIDTDRFDVQAKPADALPSLRQSDLQAMLQSLLEERFQLKLHREMREIAVYNLVIGKDPPKIKLSEDQTQPDASRVSCTRPAAISGDLGRVTPEPLQRGMVKMTGVSVNAGAITMSIGANSAPLPDFTNLLKAYAGRPVLDKTNLKGLYDFNLRFSLENSGSRSGDPGAVGQQVVRGGDPSGETLLPAIQRQLGLKLESAKEPVQVLVIDSVQRPSEN